jgi:uncharacterized protein YdaU (DUF1376 family)
MGSQTDRKGIAHHIKDELTPSKYQTQIQSSRSRTKFMNTNTNTNRPTAANLSKWMPLWVGETRRDTIGKPPEFTGMYINLMMAAWQNNGQLPDDEKQLSRISGADSEQWLEHRQGLANLFVPGTGMWTHNLIRTELVKAENISQRRSVASKKGNESRWGQARSTAKSASDALMEKITKDGAAY